ncbi:MAG: hypothetical protein ACI8UO_003768 [Verrucomicrobiales bacterium]|jgi:hypothetical protein
MKARRLLCFLPIFALAASAVAETPEIISETFETGDAQRDLTLHLIRPPGEVAGVIVLCAPGAGRVEASLENSTGYFGYLVEFARERNLAVIGFGQGANAGWDRNVNSSDLARRDASRLDRQFDEIAREWARIASRFADRNELPKADWLLYGFCGGAQYAHRLALRQPQLFKAVHVHWGGSYDVPTDKGAETIWLVTSWADEPAYVAAQKFYRGCSEKNYRIILKGHVRGQAAETDLEPDENPQAELSRRFFDFALNNTDPLKQEAEFLADYINEVVLPAGDAFWVPREQAIWLPTRELAEAWGKVEEN